MAFWGIAAAVYGGVMAVAAVTQPVARQALALAVALAYALVGAGAGTLTSSFWVNLLVPGGLLLAGYWLSGWFFRAPQPWLETWLLQIDRAMGADRWLRGAPRVVGELLEASYTTVYLVVGGGAIYAATAGVEAVSLYWSIVLTAELASYAPLPWLRSRPPRAIEGGAGRGALRRLNALILDRASVQANTLPSGHVSGAVAAALAVMAIDVRTGWMLMGIAALIAVAAAAGRYHYVVDCVAGAAVALVVWWAM